MEGCSKASARAVPGIPDNPLVEILSRLPAKSVCRFKCVSKAWRDLISDPDNRKKLRQPMKGLFVQSYASEVSEVDDDESDDEDPISFSLIDLTVSSVSADIDPFPFLTEMTGTEAFLLDSCNGLILLGKHPDGYIVCNPTTRQWSAIPACGSHEVRRHTYLAFDPAVSSHFHLVQFQMPDMHEDVVSLHVYSSETGTWSQNHLDEQKEQGQLEGWHHQFTLDTIEDQWAFVNGFLHLVLWSPNLPVQHILAIDVQGKPRAMITMPGIGDGRHDDDYLCYLGQSQGQLHCMIKESAYKTNEKLSTWVLQDYDTQEWVLKNTVNSRDVFGEKEDMPLREFEVVDIHQDRNVVLFFDMSWGELIAYDMDRKTVRDIASFNDNKSRSEFARYIPYFSELPALTNKH